VRELQRRHVWRIKTTTSDANTLVKEVVRRLPTFDPPTHRRGLLLGAPPLLLLHALAAALADPQGNISQQRLGQRGHGVGQLAPRGLPQQRLGERRHGVGQLGPVAAAGEPVHRARPPVLELSVAQEAAGVHRLGEGETTQGSRHGR